MNLLECIGARVKRLNVLDVGLLKIVCVLTGALFGGFYSRIVRKLWPVMAVMVVGMSIPLFVKILKE